jgi:hypothetical protein
VLYFIFYYGGRAGFPFVVASFQLHFYNVVRGLSHVSLRQQAKIAFAFQQSTTAILAAGFRFQIQLSENLQTTVIGNAVKNNILLFGINEILHSAR